MEYWFADYFGRIWLRIWRRKQPLEGRTAGCRVVAHGGVLPAGQLWAVQEFAARAWFSVAFVSSALVGVVAIAGAALPKIGWRDTVAYFLLIPINIGIISGAQMGMISYRRNQTSRYVLRGGPKAASKPSEAPRGFPRSSDFWVILTISLIGSALIFYSGTHPRA